VDDDEPTDENISTENENNLQVEVEEEIGAGGGGAPTPELPTNPIPRHLFARNTQRGRPGHLF